MVNVIYKLISKINGQEKFMEEVMETIPSGRLRKRGLGLHPVPLHMVMK